jgi:hypothetical protein
MKSKGGAAKTVARKSTAKRVPRGKVTTAKTCSDIRRRYQVYDTTVEPQHATREQIVSATGVIRPLRSRRNPAT